jgi:hypothetical protein
MKGRDDNWLGAPGVQWGGDSHLPWGRCLFFFADGGTGLACRGNISGSLPPSLGKGDCCRRWYWCWCCLMLVLVLVLALVLVDYLPTCLRHDVDACWRDVFAARCRRQQPGAGGPELPPLDSLPCRCRSPLRFVQYLPCLVLALHAVGLGPVRMCIYVCVCPRVCMVPGRSRRRCVGPRSARPLQTGLTIRGSRMPGDRGLAKEENENGGWM